MFAGFCRHVVIFCMRCISNLPAMTETEEKLRLDAAGWTNVFAPTGSTVAISRYFKHFKLY